jgi:DNA-binding response OmpR family regulator
LTTKNLAQYGFKERQRVLVIDNDQDMLMLLSRTLELEGYNTFVIADYDEVVSLIERFSPDLIILDTYQPDITYLKMLDTIRIRSDVPIVVITADNELETLRTVFAHGADDFVRKPFNLKPFIARIKAKLRRYRGEVIAPY